MRKLLVHLLSEGTRNDDDGEKSILNKYIISRNCVGSALELALLVDEGGDYKVSL